jgi:hypothetical protein
MHAIWRSLSPNERRIARALAVMKTPIYSEQTAAAVGISRASIGRAFESLRDNADVIEVDGIARLTDPLFEYWLHVRRLTPSTGGEKDDAD